MGEARSGQMPRAPPSPSPGSLIGPAIPVWVGRRHKPPTHMNGVLALPCLCFETRRGVRLEDTSPSQALVERGFVAP